MQVQVDLHRHIDGLSSFQNVIMDNNTSAAAIMSSYQEIQQESGDFMSLFMNSDSMAETTAAGKDDEVENYGKGNAKCELFL